jgi:hypothetical protein
MNLLHIFNEYLFLIYTCFCCVVDFVLLYFCKTVIKLLIWKMINLVISLVTASGLVEGYKAVVMHPQHTEVEIFEGKE